MTFFLTFFNQNDENCERKKGILWLIVFFLKFKKKISKHKNINEVSEVDYVFIYIHININKYRELLRLCV